MQLGDLVVVQPRTWPGINKPGGVGKLTALTSTDCTVKYVLGGSDTCIPLSFVSPQTTLQKRSRVPAAVLNVAPPSPPAAAPRPKSRPRTGNTAASARGQPKARRSRPNKPSGAAVSSSSSSSASSSASSSTSSSSS
eukprot:CAMPEP_0182453950 /NCGR_PEP_ID=MMETSP1319-20130603/788_1 /TAXON_ID=172717 /ORGANISM="Bolidomonas pacifica, Strain RCC208" /LENGTH=136 /DNA_ID=CAMNT_0024651911 /DNA_START=25 /DNA_END=431 /DNA_ORIENTATION=+